MTDQKDTLFKVGNQFWKKRAKHGVDAIFDDPEKLREACEEYFDWVHDNPLIEEKVGFYEGTAVRTDTSKMRAMTIEGLTIFLGIVPRTWRKWRDERSDLVPIIDWAETVMRNQKFGGAAAGLLNHHIIARDLGLNDIRAIQHLDADGEKADAPSISASKEIADAVHAELAKARADNDADSA